MKKRMCNILIAMCAALTLTACSEDVFGVLNGNGDDVTLTISYKDLNAKEITVSRATAAENALNNLQVFIFSEATGKLKGYKYLSASELVQNGSVGEVDIKTTTGDAYIYAVANAKTAIYNMATTGKTIPSAEADAWSETEAQLGQIDFTLDDLKAIAFNRTAGEKDIAESNFMMSGSANGGEPCTITKTSGGMAAISSPTSSDEQLIKLHRIVAKVTFNIKTGTKAGRTIEFKPTTYDFCNIPIEGSLIAGAGIVPQNFEDFTGGSFSAQKPGVFETYLPENLQEAQSRVTKWDDREADGGIDEDKYFTNAPTNGTYVVLHGTYTEKDATTQAITRDATVRYYIHLGDFSTSMSDFSVKRNYHYTYNVTVNGVDNIVVQVTAQNDGEQPGAEGLVFDYNNGTAFMLDSHYDYCVMQFNRDEVRTLKDNGYGYTFKVKALDSNGTLRESDKIVVTNASTLDAEQTKKVNDVDIEWAKFLKGGTYDKTNSHGGADPGYKALRDKNGYTDHSQTNVGMNVVELLSHLYNLDYNSDEWDSNGNLTYTCYVSENYYDDFNWGKYVNIDPRMLYIANTVNDSPDERSVHATVKYTVQQYSIKTFYNTDYDGSITAYGLETIRDDHKNGANNPGSVTTVVGSSRWDGMANMKQDLDENNSQRSWDGVRYQDLKLACMSRNRDLNGDGHIDNSELRWYTPAIDQYAGMWIGENALTDTKVRCYTQSTTTLSEPNGDWLNRNGAEHYFSNTKGMRDFWAEEGMATSDVEYNRTADKKIKFVRCIRNMKSHDLALSTTPDKYYVTDGRTIDLSRIAPSALRTSIQETELAAHTERGIEKDIANAARKFTYARYNTAGKISKNDNGYNVSAVSGNGKATMKSVSTDNATLCSKYSENGVATGWRAPNQRELCLMYILDAYDANSSEGCRTSFSGPQLRYSWYINGTPDITMGGNNPNYNVSLRCVRDTK